MKEGWGLRLGTYFLILDMRIFLPNFFVKASF